MFAEGATVLHLVDGPELPKFYTVQAEIHCVPKEALFSLSQALVKSVSRSIGISGISLSGKEHGGILLRSDFKLRPEVGEPREMRFYIRE
jgi:hypothetical protein